MVTTKEIREFESALNNIVLENNITMSKLLAMSLYQGIYCNDYINVSPNKIVKKIIKYILIEFGLINPIKIQRNPKYPISYNKYSWLVSFLSSRKNLFEMSNKVRKVIAKHHSVTALVYDQDITRLFLKEKINQIQPEVIASFHDANWRKKYRKAIKITDKIINQNCAILGLKGLFISLSLRLDLRVQIFYYTAYKKYLEFSKPVCIIVETDRNNAISPLIMAAKYLSIKTISLMHGNVHNAFGYVPILADKLFVWGKQQKNKLISSGADSEKIVVTGAPHMERIISGEKPIILKKLGIDHNKKIALLATSNYKNIQLREMLMKIFCDAILELDDLEWHGVIKLHPEDDQDLYTKFEQGYKNISFWTDDKLNINDSLVIADYCCFYSSAFAFEALAAGKQLIIINVSDKYLGEVAILAQEGGVPKVESTKSLIKQIKEGLSPEMLQLQADMSKHYYKAVGEDAVENIYKSALNLVNSKRSQHLHY